MSTLRNASIAALLLGVSVVGTALAESADADIYARIVNVVSISKDTDMRFPDLTAGGSDGTVILGSDGSLNTTGGVGIAGGSTDPAVFDVAGVPLTTFSISLPPSASIDDGLDSMDLDNFTSNPDGNGQIDGSGHMALTIGATLHVPGDQPVGNYSGSFTVTVAYN